MRFFSHGHVVTICFYDFLCFHMFLNFFIFFHMFFHVLSFFLMLASAVMSYHLMSYHRVKNECHVLDDDRFFHAMFCSCQFT